MKFVDQLELRGKKVLLRADLNVPLNDDRSIADDIRIRASLPTIQLICQAGGAVVLCSHLGSPKGKVDAKLSLAPVAKRLSELLGQSVTLAKDCVGSEVKQQADQLRAGQVLLLENLRYHAGEEANDAAFARELASLAQVFVNDAFGTAHRAHASTVGVVSFFSEKAGGLTLKAELDYFAKAFENPQRPFVALFGGVKISTKMAALRNVGKRADKIIVGGAMANTLLAAEGKQLGKSLVESEEFEQCKAIKKELSDRGCELILPVDFVVAEKLAAGVPTQTVSADAVAANMMALDIGPKSCELFRRAMDGAKTIIWNGPMGAFETTEFSKGTYDIVDYLSTSKALTVVGGGDTDLALHEAHAFDKMSYVSTGGGAFLKLLEGKTLPAVKALE